MICATINSPVALDDVSGTCGQTTCALLIVKCPVHSSFNYRMRASTEFQRALAHHSSTSVCMCAHLDSKETGVWKPGNASAFGLSLATRPTPLRTQILRCSGKFTPITSKKSTQTSWAGLIMAGGLKAKHKHRADTQHTWLCVLAQFELGWNVSLVSVWDDCISITASRNEMHHAHSWRCLCCCQQITVNS